MRLFLSLNAPPAVREALHSIAAQAESGFKGSAKWTSPDRYHLTLRFFGNVEDHISPQLISTVQSICADQPAFELRFKGVGAFPNWRRTRIIWAGFSEKTGHLFELEKKIRSVTAHFGQPPDDRDFSPHLTLARVKDLRGPASEPNIKGVVPSWPVREVTLLKSDLKPSGPVYSVVETFELGIKLTS